MSLLTKPRRKTEVCNGQIYRYDESTYLNKKNAIVTESSWTPMRRLSCKGCSDCGGYGPADEFKDAGAVSDIECGTVPISGCYYLAVFVKEPLHGPDWVDEGDGHWSMTAVDLDELLKPKLKEKS